VNVDDLLGKHFAILGTTGTGKSCAVATVLRAILNQHGNGHIVILDPHNEYSPAFAGKAEVISPSTLELPYWLLNFDEMKELVIGGSRPGMEGDALILNQVIVHAKRALFGTNEPDFVITVDSPMPTAFGRQQVHRRRPWQARSPDRQRALSAAERALRPVAGRQAILLHVPGALAARDKSAKILSRLFAFGRRQAGDHRGPVRCAPGSHQRRRFLLCRMTFDSMWSDRAVPVLLVCEAHRYAPNDPAAGFEPTKRAIARSPRKDASTASRCAW
jgi:hypothetical protein